MSIEELTPSQVRQWLRDIDYAFLLVRNAKRSGTPLRQLPKDLADHAKVICELDWSAPSTTPPVANLHSAIVFPSASRAPLEKVTSATEQRQLQEILETIEDGAVNDVTLAAVEAAEAIVLKLLISIRRYQEFE